MLGNVPVVLDLSTMHRGLVFDTTGLQRIHHIEEESRLRSLSGQEPVMEWCHLVSDADDGWNPLCQENLGLDDNVDSLSRFGRRNIKIVATVARSTLFVWEMFAI